MNRPADRPCRRRFLKSAGLVAAGGVAGVAGTLSLPALEAAWRRAGIDSPVVVGPKPKDKFSMPGPFPGRVVEIHDPASVTNDNQIVGDRIRGMIERGMCDLTGSDNAADAWRSFVSKDDVIGIKVNPVGKSTPRNRAAASSISQPEVIIEIVRQLNDIGVPKKNIIIFERYADEFTSGGYADLMRTRPMEGVRWLASSAGYSEDQVSLDGVDNGGRKNHSPELLRHVAGYDPDVYAHMGFASPKHDPKDDRRFRSHLSLIVTQMVSKIITIPVLKDHRSAGVTLALKNMSHGMNNNVARSHIHGFVHGFPNAPFQEVVNPNQCNTFIPTAVSHGVLRDKAVLHILDGLIACYEGGPGNWNKTWATWRRKSLFFATDPVAMDHVGWDIVDAERVQRGLPRVGEMGRLSCPPQQRTAVQLAMLTAPGSPAGAVTMTAAGRHLLAGYASDTFERRQPDHIPLAGSIGLGTFDSAKIVYRRAVV